MTTSASPQPRLLTPRQLEVLELMAKGLTNREIAGVLGISAATVKVHVSAVIDALDVTNRTEAAVALQELGIGSSAPGPQGDEPDGGAQPGVPGFGERPAIAVLPFDAMGDEADPGLVDGMVEDLITRLAAWRWFPVIARNSTFTYRGRAVDVTAVARELGAGYVIEGSVRRSGDRLRVTVQLLEGRSGHHVFAERFDRTVDDVFDAQDEIVDTVVGALAPVLLQVEGVHALHKPAASLSAWEAFQRGVTLLRAQAPDPVREAERFLATAVEHDPTFAPAHGERAFAHVALATFAMGATQFGPTDAARMQEAVAEAGRHIVAAAESARRALEVDPWEPTAQLATGVLAALQGRVPEAVAALERSLEINPSSAMAAWALGVVRMGTERIEEGHALLTRALRLSPHDPLRHHFLGALAAACLLTGRGEEGLAAARRSVEAQPEQGLSYVPLVVSALVRLGRMDEAREEADRLRALRPDFNLALARSIGPPPVIELMQETLAAAGWDVPG